MKNPIRKIRKNSSQATIEKTIDQLKKDWEDHA